VSDLNTVGPEALVLPDPDIVFRRLPDGQGRPGEVGVDLLLEGRPISTCAIIPLTLRIGAATVRMDGIGMVGTLPQYRGRGYARRLLSAALAHMAAGDAALTMLYGIPNFYLQFGYTPSDALARTLQEWVKSVTAAYKYPRQIVFVTELPKTISGKIRRIELRERARQEAEAPRG